MWGCPVGVGTKHGPRGAAAGCGDPPVFFLLCWGVWVGANGKEPVILQCVCPCTARAVVSTRHEFIGW